MQHITAHPSRGPAACASQWIEVDQKSSVIVQSFFLGPQLYLATDTISYNVNPGLINPKQLFDWEGTIKRYQIMTIGGVPPLIFINHGLAKSGVDITKYLEDHRW